MFKFLCGLTTTIELEESEMFVKLFVKVKNLKILSECFEYEMQLKPYAQVYSEFKKEKRILKEEEAIELSKLICLDRTQFHQIDLDDQKLISPYLPLFEDKTDKFRKYLENDDYHTCIEDDEFEFNNQWDFEDSSEDSDDEDGGAIKEEEVNEPKCPKNCCVFRNIDKLRIIEKSMNEIANINLIKKHPDFADTFFIRNYLQYKDKMSDK